MELESLRRFVQTVDSGGVTAAARALGLSASSVSRSISSLESELGAPLFDPGRETLTGAGRAALPHARRAVADAEAVRDSVADLVRASRTVRVSSCSPTPLWRIADVASSELPGTIVSSSLVPGSSEAARALLQGAADMAVTLEPLRAPGFRTQEMMRERLLVSVKRGTPLARKGSATFADLAGQTILLYKNIGFWEERGKGRIPGARLVVQDDWNVFVSACRSSDAVHFVAGPDERLNEPGRVVLPVTDEEASVVYHASWADSPRAPIARQVELLGRKLAEMWRLEGGGEQAAAQG